MANIKMSVTDIRTFALNMPTLANWFNA